MATVNGHVELVEYLVKEQSVSLNAATPVRINKYIIRIQIIMLF